jgi:hypothetical protein
MDKTCREVLLNLIYVLLNVFAYVFDMRYQR